MLFKLITNVVLSIWKAYWFFAYSMVISTAIYSTFYLLYLPQSQHVKPVHFSYDSNCQQELGDGYCSFPEALVYLHDSSKAQDDGQRVLTRGQAYDISLELETPVSERNMEVGVFLIGLELFDKEGKLLQHSTRPAMLKYENSLLSTVSTCFYVVPFLLGWKEQKETLHISLLENYADDSYKPVVKAKITLRSKFVQWYSAVLRVSAKFTGLRYYMHNWPILFSIFSFLSTFLVISVFFLWRSAHSFSTASLSHPSSVWGYDGDDSSVDGDQVEDLEPSDNGDVQSQSGRNRRRANETVKQDKHLNQEGFSEDTSSVSETDSHHEKVG